MRKPIVPRYFLQFKTWFMDVKIPLKTTRTMREAKPQVSHSFVCLLVGFVCFFFGLLLLNRAWSDLARSFCFWFSWRVALGLQKESFVHYLWMLSSFPCSCERQHRFSQSWEREREKGLDPGLRRGGNPHRALKRAKPLPGPLHPTNCLVRLRLLCCGPRSAGVYQ